MADRTINLRIDVSKIDKSLIFEGKKGKYLDLVCFFKEEKDQYGNNGMIKQSAPKEKRGDMPILGNASVNDGGSRNAGGAPSGSVVLPPAKDDADDDLPF